MTPESAAPPMHRWAQDLWPINRSITGEGVRTTLAYLAGLIPGLTRHAVPSGTVAFDWVVPPEWNVREAYIADAHGRRIIDFAENNLHLIGYSEPIDAVLSLEELDRHLHVHPTLPDAIPYVTSFYKRRQGFCLSQRQRAALPDGSYRVVIDATLEPGVLDYADVVYPGDSDREVLISTYVCHPSMANNELSGIVVAAALAQWIAAMPRRRYTYRFVFVPETIGSIVYIANNLHELKANTVAGFVVTCVGDDRAYSFLPSRLGDTLADRIALSVLRDEVDGYISYPLSERGSDERQYCSPPVNLPVVSIQRSKYAEYPEYHTSLDDLSLLTTSGLEGGLAVYMACVRRLERNFTYVNTVPCEPQLVPRGLYPSLSTEDTFREVQLMMDVVAYSDGNPDILRLSDRLGASFEACATIAERLLDAGVLARAA